MSVGPYFHGGIPGLHVGGLILPPSVTGTPTTADFGAGQVCRRDRIYATTQLSAARVFAALAPVTGAGDVYEVELEEPVEPDSDFAGDPGVSVCAPAATIVRIVERRVALGVAKSELAAHVIATARALGKDVGRNEPCPCGSGKKFKKCCLFERRRVAA